MSCLLSTCLCECGGGGVRKEESGERKWMGNVILTGPLQMQVHFDGTLGFPGGLVSEMETVVSMLLPIPW